MATIKSFTSLEQSMKLAEILPIESADIVWVYSAFEDDYFPHFLGFRKIVVGGKDIKAWSLAALLEQLDDEITDDKGNDYNLTIVKESLQYQLYYHDSWGQVEDIETNYYDDLVDACVEMIELLHEQNIL